MQSLTVGGIVANAFIFGIRNAASLLAAIILWALTLWVPYINVGTTIGLLGLVASMARGEVVSPMEIFKSQYRQQMGPFFLLISLMGVSLIGAALFFFLPAVVLGLTWCLAPLLVIDKKFDPIDALQKSANLTFGKKWTIAFGLMLTGGTVYSVLGLLVALGLLAHPIVGGLLGLLGLPIAAAVNLGAQAYIYGNLNGMLAEERPVNPPLVLGLSFGSIALASILLAVVGNITAQSVSELNDTRDRMGALERKLEKEAAAAPSVPAPIAEVEQPPATPTLSDEPVADSDPDIEAYREWRESRRQQQLQRRNDEDEYENAGGLGSRAYQIESNRRGGRSLLDDDRDSRREYDVARNDDRRNDEPRRKTDRRRRLLPRRGYQAPTRSP